MFPASFVPYIIKLIAPKLTEKIANHVAKAFKLPQVLNYMELPNDADKKLIMQGKKLESQGKEIKLLREMVIDLGKESHPPVIDFDEWKDVKDTIKKLKNKKAFKKLGK